MKLGASADADWSHIDKPQGRICGGKYLRHIGGASPEEEQRPLQKVECDMPMTLTDSVIRDGKEWVVLEFTEEDPEDPFNWSLELKIFLTFILCGMTLFIGLATTAYSSGIARMVKDLHSVAEIGQLGLFAFNQTCAAAPLFLAPFCELVGRRIIYVGGYLGFSLCFIGLALGKNMGTIIALRAVLGLFGCIGTILVGGTFDDMFRPEERAIPMAVFAWVAILGTVGAPIYAGFVDQKIGWRWLEAIQGLANIPLLAICVFGLRETRGSVTLQKRAKILRKETGDDRWVAKQELESPGLKQMLYNSSVKAVIMLCTESVVFFFGIWIAFAWFLAFLFLSVIPITFSEKKGWGEGVSGLPYIALCIGCTLAFAANFAQIFYYNKKRKAAGHAIPPENRLYGAMFGAIFLPFGLFIYSFTQYEYITWVAPCIGLGCIAFGIFFIFESCYSYTSDCYGQNSSSAIAGQGFMRNTLGAVSPLFAHQFFKNVGSQYAGLILSVVALFLTALPYVLFKFGPTIRARSKRAIRYDEDGDKGSTKSSGSDEKSIMDGKPQPSDAQKEHASSPDDSSVESKKNVEIV